MWMVLGAVGTASEGARGNAGEESARRITSAYVGPSRVTSPECLNLRNQDGGVEW
jgi:hypothetical protein